MIKKALHRITVCWCLYGLYLVLSIINPFVFKIYNIVGDRLDFSFTCEPDNIEDFIVVYFWFFVAVIAVFASCAGIHFASDWFFNVKKQ